MQPFKAISYALPAPGTRLIVLGAVHGDEVCGTRAIERVVREIDAGAIRLVAGRLTLVPVTNPLAYAHRRRAGDRNLNRKLAPTPTPREHEDHVANWLCPLLAEHEVLLDLHSFRAPGVPFVFIGPRDNGGPPGAVPAGVRGGAGAAPRRRSRRRRLARHVRGGDRTPSRAGRCLSPSRARPRSRLRH